jgi:hypothetical protein
MYVLLLYDRYAKWSTEIKQSKRSAWPSLLHVRHFSRVLIVILGPNTIFVTVVLLLVLPEFLAAICIFENIRLTIHYEAK